MGSCVKNIPKRGRGAQGRIEENSEEATAESN